jgi:hypothetical protein
MVAPKSSAGIFYRRYSIEVIRTYAQLVPARVIDLQAVRDWPDIQLVEDSVCTLKPSFVPNLPVAVE